jgi:Na+-transporting NADH:ubiquinone oxidoreductase subunit B
MGLKEKLHNIKEKGKGKKWLAAFSAFHTFLYTPNETTHSGSHIRVADDLKRTMTMVILPLIPIFIFSMFNVGYQQYIAIHGYQENLGFFSSEFWNLSNLLVGASKMIPLLLVSYIVGLGIEILFATINNHEVEEGYLVTGMLIPLIVPVDTPLWMLTIAIIFGVIIGKEIFGGTGMNILNPALTIRAFLFFAYPTWMSGDKVWVTGAVERSKEIMAGANLDAISGETILGGLAGGKHLAYSVADMFYGFIPGSVGETSTLLILLGAIYLIYTKIGSWRIMLSAVIGAVTMGLIFNSIVNIGWIQEGSKFYALMNTPFWEHLIIGGFAFGVVFMATDPVTASQTNKGKWIYGFLIGFISIMIRVFNPAYPEGVMLAILLMNVFAPTIDHYVIAANIKKRLKRLKPKTVYNVKEYRK